MLDLRGGIYCFRQNIICLTQKVRKLYSEKLHIWDMTKSLFIHQCSEFGLTVSAWRVCSVLDLLIKLVFLICLFLIVFIFFHIHPVVDNMPVFESQTFNPFDLSTTGTYSFDVDPDENLFQLVVFIIKLSLICYVLLCFLILFLLEYQKSLQL